MSIIQYLFCLIFRIKKPVEIPERLIIHEAGHLIVAEHFNRKISKIWINKKKGELKGFVDHGPGKQEKKEREQAFLNAVEAKDTHFFSDAVNKANKINRKYNFQELQICVAGVVAELLWCRTTINHIKFSGTETDSFLLFSSRYGISDGEKAFEVASHLAGENATSKDLAAIITAAIKETYSDLKSTPIGILQAAIVKIKSA